MVLHTEPKGGSLLVLMLRLEMPTGTLSAPAGDGGRASGSHSRSEDYRVHTKHPNYGKWLEIPLNPP
jgi:hypothetical protein